MTRDLQRLANESFDLLIIGGGVNGLATAWDATLRGLRVALVEKHDYGAETSANSLKIIHGGLRYLQHFDFPRMRESIRERSAFLRNAGHLVRPLPFLIPTYGHGMKGREAMRAAMLLNDMISHDRNRGCDDPVRRLPGGRILSASACLGCAPLTPRDGLTGGAVFYDAQMRNAERTTLLFALSAASEGAALANYTEAVSWVKRDRHLDAVRVRDQLCGDEFVVRARIVADLSGPWVKRLLFKEQGGAPPGAEIKSAGVQIVTAPFMEEDMGYAVTSHHLDPDARIQRGGRHFFATPWRGYTLWGTTDKRFEGNPDDWRIEESDVVAFIDELNEALPGIALDRKDVIHAFGGLRPVDPENLGSGSQVSREAEIVDHAKSSGIDNLISVEGVKYTTCRHLAEKTTNLVFRKLGRPSPPCTTLARKLAGGGFDTLESCKAEARAQAPTGVDGPMAERLVDAYGADYPALYTLLRADARLARKLPDANLLAAEVMYAVREESAVRLEDVLLRRLDHGLMGPLPEALLQACAELMAVELGWDAARTEDEAGRVRRTYV